MGRPSNRDARRAELLTAFARVLATHGYAGATIAAVAAEAGVAPGLVHHHFDSKEELLSALLQALIAGFRSRIEHYEARRQAPRLRRRRAQARRARRRDRSALLGRRARGGDAQTRPCSSRCAGCIDTEIGAIEQRSGYTLSTRDASSVLAYVIGALVVGAFAPQKTAGFAAPGLRRLIAALRERR